ncbi:MAG: hypothetical protein ABJ360_17035 [Roseobacter sp.]
MPASEKHVFEPPFRVIAVSMLFLTACSAPPELVGIDNPDIPSRSVEGATRQRVFVATTRQATEAVGAFYSELRAPELGLASVQVSIYGRVPSYGSDQRFCVNWPI